MIMLQGSALILAVVFIVQTRSQKGKSDDSLQGVPSDLRRAVSEAVALERRFLLGANVAQNCTSEEDEASTTPCPPSKYRSASGECNNVRHRPWGRRGDIFLRLMPPQYADGPGAAGGTSSCDSCRPSMLTVSWLLVQVGASTGVQQREAQALGPQGGHLPATHAAPVC
ncbi:peroxidase domain-containing protein [Phthorimaea operculella]|nr:peroxidase domain-containing protein [Phthorimaea operculella]